jgi:hypothetical protein
MRGYLSSAGVRETLGEYSCSKDYQLDLKQVIR